MIARLIVPPAIFERLASHWMRLHGPDTDQHRVIDSVGRHWELSAPLARGQPP